MKRAAISLAALFALLLCGYLLSQHLGANGDTSFRSVSPQAFGPTERQAFAALKGPTRPVPLGLQVRLRRARDVKVRSLWLGAARYVPVDSGLWVANGKGETCIIQAHGGAVSCVSRTILLRKGVALGVVNLGPPPRREPREFVVVGLVPDQVRAVVLLVGKRTRTVAVRDNAYSLRATVPIVVKRFEP